MWNVYQLSFVLGVAVKLRSSTVQKLSKSEYDMDQPGSINKSYNVKSRFSAKQKQSAKFEAGNYDTVLSINSTPTKNSKLVPLPKFYPRKDLNKDYDNASCLFHK